MSYNNIFNICIFSFYSKIYSLYFLVNFKLRNNNSNNNNNNSLLRRYGNRLVPCFVLSRFSYKQSLRCITKFWTRLWWLHHSPYLQKNLCSIFIHVLSLSTFHWFSSTHGRIRVNAKIRKWIFTSNFYLNLFSIALKRNCTTKPQHWAKLHNEITTLGKTAQRNHNTG